MKAEDSGWGRRVPGMGVWAGHGLVMLSVLGVLLALGQRFSGLGLTELRVIGPPGRISPQDGYWRWRFSGNELSVAQEAGAVVLENGRKMGRRATSGHEMTPGGGWYRVGGRQVRFAPKDGSDPRTNGRRYELRVPTHVRDRVWWILAGTFALGLGLTRGRVWLPVAGAAGMWRRVPAGVKMGGFFLGFLAVRAWQLWESDYSDGVMSLKGAPGSDAAAWQEMARLLASGLGFGEGFAAQRPLYSVLLALFHQIFGSTTAVSLAVNCVLQAVTATTVLVLGGMLGSRLVGLTVACWLMISPYQVALAQVVLTENFGGAFGALGLLTFWMLLLKRSLPAAALAGLTVGLGNLGSGVFLLTVPLYPLLLVWQGWRRGWGVKRTAGCAAVFCTAVCVLFLPWMARQQRCYGVFTISLNTAELLYGGAHPVEKKLSRALHQAARADGISQSWTGERYRYFMEKYVALVKEDPVRYGKQVAEALTAAAEYAPRGSATWQWLVRWMVVLVTAGECLRRGFWLPSIPGGAALLVLHRMDELSCFWSLVVAAAVVLWCAPPRQRLGWWLVVWTAGAFLLLAAMSGNVATGRFLTAGDWLLFLLWCGAWRSGVVQSSAGLDWLWGRLTGRPRAEPDRLMTRPGGFRLRGGHWMCRAARLMCGLCLLSMGSTLAAYQWRSTHPRPVRKLDEAVAAAVRKHVAAHYPLGRGLKLPEAALRVDAVVFDDQRTWLDKEEDIRSMTWMHGNRREARWVAGALRLGSKPALAERAIFQIPAAEAMAPPVGEPLVVVWVVNPGDREKFGQEMSLNEVVAIYPLEPPAPHEGEMLKPVLERVEWYRATEGVRRAVQQFLIRTQTAVSRKAVPSRSERQGCGSGAFPLS